MPVTRRKVLQVLAGTGLASLAPMHTALAAAEAGAAATPLKTLAARKGLRFGNAIGIGSDRGPRPRGFRDPAYRALMARECGVIVAENETKWQALQPRPGEFNFSPADEMFAWARQQGLQIRGHTLLWQTAKWLPKWVSEHDFGAQPAQEAERLLGTHINTVCRHFGDSIYSYDVVNEAVDPANGALRENVLTQRLGAIEEIDLAFRLARAAAPQARLVYNDYMRWDGGSAQHRAGVLKLLAALKTRGTPVQALGLQSHIGSWDESAQVKAGAVLEWRKFLDEASGMGLELLITEFDVNDRKLAGDIAKRDVGVAALARDYLDVTLSYPNLTDFLTWGLCDDLSWLQSWKEAPRTDGLAMRPCPYDGQLRAKPLREAIAAAMIAMPPRA